MGEVSGNRERTRDPRCERHAGSFAEQADAVDRSLCAVEQERLLVEPGSIVEHQRVRVLLPVTAWKIPSFFCERAPALLFSAKEII